MTILLGERPSAGTTRKATCGFLPAFEPLGAPEPLVVTALALSGLDTLAHLRAIAGPQLRRHREALGLATKNVDPGGSRSDLSNRYVGGESRWPSEP